jgi:outer membrane protein OmpA-like peptidoglycan-associated protein
MQRASQLHLQMGQEVIYVLMTLGLMTAFILLVSDFSRSQPAPTLPDCALAGQGPCISEKNLPDCSRAGLGPCQKTAEIPRLPDCARSGQGPCLSPQNLPDCSRAGLGPCQKTAEMPRLPDCALSGRGPCISQKDLPDCSRPGLGPCQKTAEIPPPASERPPILNLTEREGFRFATGSYDVDAPFIEKLRNNVAPQILKLSREHNATVVEVVGHTDGVPIRAVPDTGYAPSGAQSSSDDEPATAPQLRSPVSTLDRRLVAYLAGANSDDKSVEVADNVGLGMMRAAAVVRALSSLSELKDRGFTFLAMSAGQTIAPNDRPIGLESGIPAGDGARRRVEIRLRRSLYKP